MIYGDLQSCATKLAFTFAFQGSSILEAAGLLELLFVCSAVWVCLCLFAQLSVLLWEELCFTELAIGASLKTNSASSND